MGTLSDWGAGANVLKGLIGLGILTLPYATTQIGWLGSIIGFALVALMSVQGIFFALWARLALEKAAAEGPDEESTILDVPKLAYGTGFFDTVVRQVLGWTVQWLFTLCIATTQLTTAVSYVDTIATSVDSYIEHPNEVLTIAVIGAVLFLLSLVKTLSGISYLSYMGLLTYCVVFGILIAQALRSGQDGNFAADARALRGGLPGYGTWFGLTVFAFGGLPVALAVYDDMRDPRHFQKVVSISYFVCWAFYTVFAMLGYLAYGDDTSEVIYFNFPRRSVRRNCTLVAICIVLLLSYCLQMVPVTSFMEGACKGMLHWIVVRGLLILFTLVVAYLVPSLVTIITVGGAIASAISSFFIPPMVYLIVKPQAHWTEYAMAVMLFVLGGCGAVLNVL